MDLINHKWSKYLLLIPVIVLLLNAIYNKHVTQRYMEAIMEEKRIEIVNTVDLLAAAVEANEACTWSNHEVNIVHSVEFLDAMYQVYAAAYKVEDGELALITERTFETSIFDPLDFPEFTQAVSARESGSLSIGYAPEDQSYRDLFVYFRWMPLYSQPGERYLVAAGVSVHSIMTEIPAMVCTGQWVSMAITFVLNAALVILLARHKREQNEQNGGGKHFRC
jgi:hypothetical protein